jgi:hypothetical protein
MAQSNIIQLSIKRLVSFNQIKRKVLKRVKLIYPNLSVEFKVGVSFPVKHILYIKGRKTDFNFTYHTIKDLLNVSKLNEDPYQFVVESMYYSVLKEIKKHG